MAGGLALTSGLEPLFAVSGATYSKYHRPPYPRLIAFLTDRVTIERILTHLGEPTVPPAIAAARAPPHSEAEFDQRPARDVDQPEPVPDIDFGESGT